MLAYCIFTHQCCYRRVRLDPDHTKLSLSRSVSTRVQTCLDPSDTSRTPYATISELSLSLYIIFRCARLSPFRSLAMESATIMQGVNNLTITKQDTPKPNFISTFDMHSNYLPFKVLCGELPIGSILNLTRTCRSLAGAYQESLRTEWDIDKRLSELVKDPRCFRGLMACNDVLITGPFALHFFLRTEQKTSGRRHPDVFIQEGKKADAFVQAVCETEGYEVLATDSKSNGLITSVKNDQ